VPPSCKLRPPGALDLLPRPPRLWHGGRPLHQRHPSALPPHRLLSIALPASLPITHSACLLGLSGCPHPLAGPTPAPWAPGCTPAIPDDRLPSCAPLAALPMPRLATSDMLPGLPCLCWLTPCRTYSPWTPTASIAPDLRGRQVQPWPMLGSQHWVPGVDPGLGPCGAARTCIA